MEYTFNAELRAKDIIRRHFEAMITGAEFHPESEDKAYEVISSECAFILSEDLLAGSLTIQQAYEVSNALGPMLFALLGEDSQISGKPTVKEKA